MSEIQVFDVERLRCGAGHQDPAFTLRVYAHAVREEEKDISFAELGGPGRPYAAPTFGPVFICETSSTPGASSIRDALSTGIEPYPLRSSCETWGSSTPSSTARSRWLRPREMRAPRGSRPRPCRFAEDSKLLHSARS
jgi:hypothetical protein